MLEGPIVHRMSEGDLAEAATTPIPAEAVAGDAGAVAVRTPSTVTRGEAAVRRRVCAQDAQFLKAEGVVAVFNRGGDTIMYSVGSDLSVAAAYRWWHDFPDR